MPRINVTLDENTLGMLMEVATFNHKSISETAKELIVDSMDHMEDIFLSSLSDERLDSNSKKIDHKDVWK